MGLINMFKTYALSASVLLICILANNACAAPAARTATSSPITLDGNSVQLPDGRIMYKVTDGRATCYYVGTDNLGMASPVAISCLIQ